MFGRSFADKNDCIIAPDIKSYLSRRLLPALTLSGIVGIVAGTLVTLFNLALELAGEFAKLTGDFIAVHKPYIALYVAGMLAVGVFMYYFTKVFPEGKGSGILRTEAMMCGKKQLSWWRMCIATVIGSFVSFLSGIPVGAEGPSVQFGGGLGAGVEESVGRDRFARRYVGNSGIAAGVAAAFIAPCTGIVFAIEEVQREFNPLMIASACFAVMYAYLVRTSFGAVLGMHAVYFSAEGLAAVPTSFIWVAIPAGVVAALLGRLFNLCILKLDNCAYKSKLSAWIPLVLLFAVVAVVNVFVRDNIGSGALIISGILNQTYDWQTVLVLLVIKFVLVCAVFRAAPTGGMMVPMLALGAMAGALVGFACVAAGMPQECVPAVALITMSAFFGSCIKAPVTVVALFLETTGLINCGIPLVIAVFVAQLIGLPLKQSALYDTLWERDVKRTDGVSR